MENTTEAVIALGANQGEAIMQIKQAIDDLDTIDAIRVKMHSSLYLSEPMGPANQACYINAVVLAEVECDAIVLLDCLQALEIKYGRVREERWGERTLDLDIITYGTQIINTPRLSVPHPGVSHRCFVLMPLAEIAPQMEIPQYGKVSDLLKDCDTGTPQKIGK